MRGTKNCLPIFDRVQFQGEEESEESETYFGSLGSALSADISQTLLSQMQGYKISFEGGTTHLSNKFAWKVSLYNICQLF